MQNQGLLCAAVTNAPSANAALLLSGIGLGGFSGGFFDAVILGEACARAKPFPEPYLEAMARLGVAPGECFAVEDSAPGLTAAVRAGVATVGVLTTQPPGALVEAGACLLVDDFEAVELWGYLEGAVDARGQP